MAILSISSLPLGSDPMQMTISMWAQFTSNAANAQPLLCGGYTYPIQVEVTINNITFATSGKIRPLRALNIYRTNAANNGDFPNQDSIVIDLAGRMTFD